MIPNPISQVIIEGTILVYRRYQIGRRMQYARTERNVKRLLAVSDAMGYGRETLSNGTIVVGVRPEVGLWGPTYEEYKPYLEWQEQEAMRLEDELEARLKDRVGARSVSLWG